MCASNPGAARLTHGQSVSRRLARTQRHGRLLRGEAPLVEFTGIEDKLGKLLQEFGPSGSEKTRHNPPTFTFLGIFAPTASGSLPGRPESPTALPAPRRRSPS